MIAALCLLIPPIVSVIIRNRLLQTEKKFYHNILRYLVDVLVINGLLLLLLLAFSSNGDHLIYDLNHQPIFSLIYSALALVLAIAGPFAEKGLKGRHFSALFKAVVFALFCIIIFRCVNFVVQPIWNSQNYNPTHSIYEEPKNTIETLFVGASHVHYGISPMELYEKYGICAYDMATDSQPVFASYYWIEEIYSLHPETLDTVVFDVSCLRKSPSSSYSHKAVDPMRFSTFKIQAVLSYASDFTDFITKLIPIFSYHDRWEELTEKDFMKYSYKPDVCLRGYNFSTSQGATDIEDYSKAVSPLIIPDEEAEPVVLDESELGYFERIVSFCEDHDIQLLLISAPTKWSSSEHNAVQELADGYGLEFIDFNIDPYYSEIGFDILSDVIVPASKSNLHANYYGAMKITDYLGEYLIEEYGNKDVRGDKNYSFMDDELEEYNRYITEIKLNEAEDPTEYLNYLLDQEDFEVFISVKEEGAGSLTDEQRETFAFLGLEDLSSLDYRDSYLAVIDDGIVITEEIQKYEDTMESEGPDALSITTEGRLKDGTAYSLVSCGGTTSPVSSCVIDETEYSLDSRGLNFIVYDKKQQSVIDSAAFDTHASSARKAVSVEQALSKDLSSGTDYADLSVNEQRLYCYDLLCNAKLAEKMSDDAGFLNYLSYFWDSEDYSIFISVKEDAASALSDEVRKFVSELGLVKLSELEKGDSYIAIVSGGEIGEELLGENAKKIESTGPGYKVISCGGDSDSLSSILINESQYSLNTKGLNVVIMNNRDSSVLSAKTFDTSEITPTIPEDWLS